MMSIRSLADFNGSSPGRCGDWLTPPPSPPGPQPPGRHDERGMGTFNWPPAETSTRPHTGTFSWPRTTINPDVERFGYKRAGITTIEIDSSHLVMLSHPKEAADLIRTAIRATAR